MEASSRLIDQFVEGDFDLRRLVAHRVCAVPASFLAFGGFNRVGELG
jgi:hypothetical protein